MELTQKIPSVLTRIMFLSPINLVKFWFRQNGGFLAPINAVLGLFGKRLVLAASVERTIEMYREMKADESVERWNKLKHKRMYSDYPDTVDREYNTYLAFKRNDKAYREDRAKA
jgi:hypothetical protein